MIFNGIDSKRILFIDIETAASVSTFAEMNLEMQSLWNIKATQLKKSEDLDPAQLFEDKGAIYSEFGKIVCISLGVTYGDDSDMRLKIKSFAKFDEKHLLNDFINFLTRLDVKNLVFCGHNIKEFDIPYICRRLLVNGLCLPECLNFSGKKPWEVQTIDTMDMWSFGDKKSYTSLNLLTTIFGIPSSKDDIDGSRVHETFYRDKDLRKISKYCSKDVVATTQLFLKLSGKELIDERNIEFVE